MTNATIDTSCHHTVMLKKNWLLGSPENLVESFVFYNVMLLGQTEDSTLELFIAQKRTSPGTMVRPREVILDK